jgi:hypothetical protein
MKNFYLPPDYLFTSLVLYILYIHCLGYVILFGDFIIIGWLSLWCGWLGVGMCIWMGLYS